jgi:hypothetical protein
LGDILGGQVGFFVAAIVVNIAGFHVERGSSSAGFSTGFIGAVTTFFACFLGRAGAGGFPVATGVDGSAFHVGASLVQHDVVADGHSPMRWIARVGGVIGQQAGSMQKVGEQGAKFIEHFWADGVEEIVITRVLR